MIGFYKDEAFRDKTQKNYQALEITSLKDKIKRLDAEIQSLTQQLDET